MLVAKSTFYDASIGVNYVPFNDALLAAGFTFKQKSFSVSAQLKHFKITLINDNALLINNTKKFSSPILIRKFIPGLYLIFKIA